MNLVQTILNANRCCIAIIMAMYIAIAMSSCLASDTTNAPPEYIAVRHIPPPPVLSSSTSVDTTGWRHWEVKQGELKLEVFLPNDGRGWSNMVAVCHVTNLSTNKIECSSEDPLWGFSFTVVPSPPVEGPTGKHGKACCRTFLRAGAIVGVAVKLSHHVVIAQPGLYKLFVTWENDPGRIGAVIAASHFARKRREASGQIAANMNTVEISEEDMKASGWQNLRIELKDMELTVPSFP